MPAPAGVGRCSAAAGKARRMQNDTRKRSAERTSEDGPATAKWKPRGAVGGDRTEDQDPGETIRRMKEARLTPPSREGRTGDLWTVTSGGESTRTEADDLSFALTEACGGWAATDDEVDEAAEEIAGLALVEEVERRARELTEAARGAREAGTGGGAVQPAAMRKGDAYSDAYAALVHAVKEADSWAAM